MFHCLSIYIYDWTAVNVSKQVALVISVHADSLVYEVSRNPSLLPPQFNGAEWNFICGVQSIYKMTLKNK